LDVFAKSRENLGVNLTASMISSKKAKEAEPGETADVEKFDKETSGRAQRGSYKIANNEN